MSLKAKVGAIGVALGMSVGAAEAASIVYDNALRGTDGRSCNFQNTCTVALSGSDAAGGVLLTLGIDASAATNDQDFFEFSVNAFGLGLGFIANGQPNVSKFPAALTLSTDRTVTWTGGSFTAVQTNAPVVPGSETTPSVSVVGTGVNTSIFSDETNFNIRPGNAVQGSDGFTPRSFNLGMGGINFLAGETYTLSFDDFGIASDNNQAFVQLNEMEFFAAAAPAAPAIPLPPTVWMMLSVIGFFCWQKYRSS